MFFKQHEILTPACPFCFVRLSKVLYDAVILEKLTPKPDKPVSYKLKFKRGNYVCVMRQDQIHISKKV